MYIVESTPFLSVYYRNTVYLSPRLAPCVWMRRNEGAEQQKNIGKSLPDVWLLAPETFVPLVVRRIVQCQTGDCSSCNGHGGVPNYCTDPNVYSRCPPR